MDLETLKQLLKDSVITQEQFDALSKTQDEPEDKPEDKPKDDDIEMLIQKAVDRATNKLGNDNKRLKEDLEKERKKSLTTEELNALEVKEKEQAIAEREQAIKNWENRIYAIKALKRAKLDSGEEESLDLVDFVLAGEEKDIDAKVKALQKFAQGIEKKTTEAIYKMNGRTPEKGSAGASEVNPYKKETFNFTKQMELEIANPEEAKRLKAAAGV